MRPHRLRPGLRPVQHHPLRQTAAGSHVHRPSQPVRRLQDHLCHGEDFVHEGKYGRRGRGAGNGGGESGAGQGENEWVNGILSLQKIEEKKSESCLCDYASGFRRSTKSCL